MKDFQISLYSDYKFSSVSVLA